jgi:hypothetical protein
MSSTGETVCFDVLSVLEPGSAKTMTNPSVMLVT